MSGIIIYKVVYIVRELYDLKKFKILKIGRSKKKKKWGFVERYCEN